MTTEHTCIGRVWDGYRFYLCGKKAKHEHEGGWYCKNHHPPTVQAKREARDKRWEKKWAEQRERIAQQEAQRAEQKRRADLYPELLEALKDLLSLADASLAGGVSTRAAAHRAIDKAEGVKP